MITIIIYKIAYLILTFGGIIIALGKWKKLEKNKKHIFISLIIVAFIVLVIDIFLSFSQSQEKEHLSRQYDTQLKKIDTLLQQNSNFKERIEIMNHRLLKINEKDVIKSEDIYQGRGYIVGKIAKDTLDNYLSNVKITSLKNFSSTYSKSNGSFTFLVSDGEKVRFEKSGYITREYTVDENDFNKSITINLIPK